MHEGHARRLLLLGSTELHCRGTVQVAAKHEASASCPSPPAATDPKLCEPRFLKWQCLGSKPSCEMPMKRKAVERGRNAKLADKPAGVAGGDAEGN